MAGPLARAIRIVGRVVTWLRNKELTPVPRPHVALAAIVACTLTALANICLAGIIGYQTNPPSDALNYGPGDDFSDWQNIPANGINLSNQDTLDLAIDNSFDATYYKSVTYTLTGKNLKNATVQILGGKGLSAEANGKSEDPISSTPHFNAQGTELTVKQIFSVQPQWEYLGIKALANGVTISAKSKAAYECYQSNNSGKTRTGKSKGLHDEPGLQVTQFWEFPENVNIDTSSTPTFNADPSTGQWTYQFVTQDPYGNPMPHGGVEWTTNGSGLSQGQAFDWSTIMTSTADSLYQDFFFDANASPDDPDGGYIGLETACVPEPTTLIVFVILFGAGAVGVLVVHPVNHVFKVRRSLVKMGPLGAISVKQAGFWPQ